jgi:hypothetical protein
MSCVNGAHNTVLTAILKADVTSKIESIAVLYTVHNFAAE